MAKELEIEYRFALSKLPDFDDSWHMEYIKDLYFPVEQEHPQIRLRRRDNKYFLTKKYPNDENDHSLMIEETIDLDEIEYKYLDSALSGIKLEKRRYKKIFKNYIIEIDEYCSPLAPLMVMDIEVSNEITLNDIISEFDVLKEITQIPSLAAGKLAGKSFSDISEYLN